MIEECFNEEQQQSPDIVLPQWFIGRDKAQVPVWLVKGFYTEAYYKDHKQDMGFHYERMVYSQLIATYPDTEHRYIYGAKPDLYIPSLDAEIDTSLRTYDYELTDAQVDRWVRKPWAARIRIKLVSRPVKPTEAQRGKLDRKQIRVMVWDELLKFLAHVSQLWSEGIPLEFAAFEFDHEVIGYGLDGRAIWGPKRSKGPSGPESPITIPLDDESYHGCRDFYTGEPLDLRTDYG